ncbi:MAG: hypothetical protein V1697_00405 [Candidatus Levyibacteriota bacterium]
MKDIFIAPKKAKKTNQPLRTLRRAVARSTRDIRSARSTEPVLDGKKVDLLTSFRLKPSGLTFRDQTEDEEIFLFLRRHIVTNVPWALITAFLIILPAFGLLIFNASLLPFRVPLSYALVILVFYYLIVITFAFVSFLNWFYNISLVTDKRIVDIDLSEIIYHDVATTNLDLIEDVSYVQSGFIRSFFNYGDIFIQTAGEKMHFDFLAVPHPEKVIDVVQNLMGGDKKSVL